MAVVGRLRVRRAGVTLAATLSLAAAVPGAVAAQAGTNNPFGPLPQNTGTVPGTTTTAPPPVVQTTTTAGSSSVSGAGIAAIAVGAIVILVGISFFIWRDARKRAPVKQRAVAATPGGSKPRPKSRKLSPAERRRRKRGRAR
jgi:hypothetical protein